MVPRMASDARDILGDAGSHIKSTHIERVSKSEKKSKRKKPDGMSNEVYGLLRGVIAELLPNPNSVCPK